MLDVCCKLSFRKVGLYYFILNRLTQRAQIIWFRQPYNGPLVLSVVREDICPTQKLDSSNEDINLDETRFTVLDSLAIKIILLSIGLQLLGRTSAGCVWSWLWSDQVCFGTGYFLRPQGAIRPGFSTFGGWVYCSAPEAPLIRGMPTGPLVFLAMPGACGLCPATGPTLKRSCAIFVRWWDGW